MLSAITVANSTPIVGGLYSRFCFALVACWISFGDGFEQLFVLQHEGVSLRQQLAFLGPVRGVFQHEGGRRVAVLKHFPLQPDSQGLHPDAVGLRSCDGVQQRVHLARVAVDGADGPDDTQVPVTAGLG